MEGTLTSCPCPACGHRRTARGVPSGVLWCRLPLRRCGRCGSAHLELGSQHSPEDYWQASGQIETYAKPEVARARLAEMRRRLDLIGPPPEPGALLVDVGSGTGEFITEAQGRGWRCVGVEPSERATQAARRRASSPGEAGPPRADVRPSSSQTGAWNQKASGQARGPAPTSLLTGPGPPRRHRAQTVGAGPRACPHPQECENVPISAGAGHALPRASAAPVPPSPPSVAVGDARSLHVRTGQAACVTFWDVLEHLTDPVAALREAHRVLRPGGIVAVVTPNEDGLFKTLARAGWKMLGSRGAFLLSHVYYVPHYVSFTPRGLALAFQRAGLAMPRQRLEGTNIRFARAKIATHYGRRLYGDLVAFVLPAALLVARITGRGNKIVALGAKPLSGRAP